MSDLFSKLNVLVRSGLRDLVGGDALDLDNLRRTLTPDRWGKDLDAEIRALRERINQAVDYEESLKSRVTQAELELEQLEAEADDAVVSRREDYARVMLERIERARQRVTMAESDLRAHRLVTQELIQRVNTLEAVVADGKARAAEADAAVPANSASDQSVASVLRRAREDAQPPLGQAASSPIPPSSEDDMERRRRRLSKP